jgi:hypothetical protein
MKAKRQLSAKVATDRERRLIDAKKEARRLNENEHRTGARIFLRGITTVQENMQAKGKVR